MKCEFCGKWMRQGDIVHGIKYGTLASTGFIPARDSAVAVLCEECGNRICRLVYASLDEGKIAYPVIFKMVTDLTTLMKNGYKVIQAISTLPAREQSALQRLISACKETSRPV